MKLINISIQNFRSITQAEKLELSDYCILLGKNNEGKTNVLKAISFAMNSLKPIHFYARRRHAFDNSYAYKRDYPVSLLDDKDAKPTTFELTFKLDDNDKAEFLKFTGLRNNGRISIEIVFPKNGVQGEPPLIKFKEKRGRGGESYNKQKENVLLFLTNHISFQYIPAIRTADDSFEVLRGLVRNVLVSLDEDDEYNRALDVIITKRTELINKIGDSVKDKIETFIPTVKKVDISIHNSSDFGLLNDDYISFEIDDGNKTSIQYKGDGVKSLAALALLYQTKSSRRSQIIAIEEPESHLHYEAIHQIDAVLRDLSKENQVIIATHNPIFVNKDNIHNNIIIDKGVGKKASSLNQIRDLMGIRISDSLFYSDKLIIVEGETDERSFNHIFSLINSNFKQLVNDKIITFYPLKGAGKLSYVCTLLSNWLVKYCVILDYDSEGKTIYNQCQNKGLISSANAFNPTLYSQRGQCEFEDFLNPLLYKQYLFDKYGVDNSIAMFGYKNKKWSDRLSDLFAHYGKNISTDEILSIKDDISLIIEKTDDLNSILKQEAIPMFENIVSSIVEVLK